MYIPCHLWLLGVHANKDASRRTFPQNSWSSQPERKQLSGANHKKERLHPPLPNHEGDPPPFSLPRFYTRQAERVMDTLRQLASDGHTVVCSIHQPRSSIFRMFDDVMLLSEGRVMFQGPAGRVARYFRAKGHAMPGNTNPGDFAVDVVSVDHTSKVLFYRTTVT